MSDLMWVILGGYGLALVCCFGDEEGDVLGFTFIVGTVGAVLNVIVYLAIGGYSNG